MYKAARFLLRHYTVLILAGAFGWVVLAALGWTSWSSAGVALIVTTGLLLVRAVLGIIPEKK